MERKATLKVVLGYAAVATAWILFSDTLLYRLWPAAASLYHIGLAKGLAFVGVTALVLYVLIRRLMQAEQARYRTMFENSHAVMLLVDPADGAIVDANPAAVAFYGWPRQQLISLRAGDINTLAPEELSAGIGRARRGERNEFHMRHKLASGEIRDVEILSGPVTIDGRTLLYSIIHDETERVEAARALARLNRLYAMLSQTNQAIVRCTDRDRMFGEICRVAVEHGGFRFAWLGLLDRENDTVRPVTRAGNDGGYIDAVRISARASNHSGSGPTGQALRDGRHVISNDFLADPATAPWHEAARRAGIAASGAFPIRHLGVVIGSINLYATETGFFTDDALATLDEIALDVSFALDNLSREAERRQAELALAQESTRRRILFEQAKDGIFVIDATRRVIETNRSFADMVGYPPDKVLQLYPWDWDVVYPTREKLLAAWPELPDRAQTFETRIRRSDGTLLDLEVSSNPAELAGERILINVCRDITRRKQTEAELRESAMRLQMAARAGNVGLWDWDLHTNRVYYSPEWKHQIGYADHELSNEFSEWQSRLHPDDAERALRTVQDYVAAPWPNYRIEFRLRHKDGSYRWILTQAALVYDEHGKPARMLGSHVDITDRKRSEAQIAYLATHDALTDLPNRNLMLDRITQAISHARRSNTLLALMYLDLDRFKLVNDGFGHPFGDTLLQMVAKKLTGLVRDGDTVARLGGDEFLVLMPDLRKPGDVYIIAQKTLDAFEQPFEIESRQVFITPSIGVSVYPADGTDPDTLVKNADLAMYRAKDVGRNAYRVFTDDMSETIRHRVDLETRLRHALAAQQFHLVYQPKAKVATGTIGGIEALLRWTDSERGPVPPAEFIPIAEESGLIVPIGDWVLRTACTQNRAWLDAGFPPMVMAVNVSARQFLQHDMVGTVKRVLHDTGLPPELLELELTESLIMHDTRKASVTMNRLKNVGVLLSIDDFGTGYSSLGYLKRFRVDRLKIDQSFVQNLLTDPNAAAISLAVITLAHTLELQVTAEGVETAAQCAYLCEHGCDEIQGFWFSRPAPAAEISEMLRTGKRLAGSGGG